MNGQGKNPTLRELCSVIVDSEHKTAPKDPDGPHPLMRTNNLGAAHGDFAGAQRVNAQTYETWTRRARPEQGDLILAREAPVGGVCRVPANVHPMLGQRTVLLRPDEASTDGRFLMYRLAAPDLQGRMNEMATGATVPHLNMADIRSFVVPGMPNLDEQHRRGAVLGAFDELLAINERRIELLEDLARSVYREWFVRFRFPGHGCSEADAASSGGGPEGWAHVRIDEIATLNRRSIHPASQPDAWFELFSIPAFDSGALPSRELGASIRSSKFLISEDCVLVSKLNPRIRRTWFATPDTDSAVASSEFLPWTGTAVSNSWLWSMFSDDEFRHQFIGSAGGTSTSHQRLKPEDVLRHGVSLPPPELLRGFDAVAEPSLRAAQTLRRQNRALISTRDLLLPRLVTGRLDISDIDLGDLLPDADAA